MTLPSITKVLAGASEGLSTSIILQFPRILLSLQKKKIMHCFQFHSHLKFKTTLLLNFPALQATVYAVPSYSSCDTWVHDEPM